MKKLVFVTGNMKKAYEIEERFKGENIELTIFTMDFDEPNINSIEEVSKSKAIQAYKKLGTPCFVIDSGLNIHSYPNNPGYPGALVRRSGISENIDKLLETMTDVQDRSCTFLDCLTFYDGEEIYTFFGRDDGNITTEKRGKENKAMRSPLWYVFMPQGSTKTLAEMTDEERLARKDGHISAKEQFINWYKNEYRNKKVYTKK